MQAKTPAPPSTYLHKSAYETACSRARLSNDFRAATASGYPNFRNLVLETINVRKAGSINPLSLGIQCGDLTAGLNRRLRR